MEYTYVNNRGVSSESLIGGVLILVVTAVVAVVGLSMLDGLDDSFSSEVSGYNTSFEASTLDIAYKFGLIGTLIVTGFLITIVFGVTRVFRTTRAFSDEDDDEDDEEEYENDVNDEIKLEDKEKQKEISKKIKKMSQTKEDDFVVEDY